MVEVITAVISLVVLLATLGVLWMSIWRKEELISEAAWDRLIVRTRVLRGVFALSSLSLIVYLFAESAELLNLQTPSATLEVVHEIGETVHMFIAALAVLAAIPLYSAMLGGEDAP